MSLLPCISCSTKYEEKEQDAYLCPPCLESKKQKAAEIDSKRDKQPKVKIKSELEIYNELPKARGGFPDYRNFMH